MLANSNNSSIDYLYKVCREHPLLVISTPHGIGKYHFNCIGYKNSQLLIEFTLIVDNNFKDSDNYMKFEGGTIPKAKEIISRFEQIKSRVRYHD